MNSETGMIATAPRVGPGRRGGRQDLGFGLSGTGVVPGRPLDSFGIGWARTEFSSSFVPFLRQQLHLGLDREDAVEMYYNVAITRALNASLDLQIIDPALKKTLDASGRNLRDMNTAVVAGLRVYARF
jgi:porin